MCITLKILLTHTSNNHITSNMYHYNYTDSWKCVRYFFSLFFSSSNLLTPPYCSCTPLCVCMCVSFLAESRSIRGVFTRHPACGTPAIESILGCHTAYYWGMVLNTLNTYLSIFYLCLSLCLSVYLLPSMILSLFFLPPSNCISFSITWTSTSDSQLPVQCEIWRGTVTSPLTT